MNGRAERIEDQTVPALFLGHKEVPYELAMSLDREKIGAHLRARGKTQGKETQGLESVKTKFCA